MFNVPPVATRKGIPNKNRSTTPIRFRSKPKIVNFAHPFFNFAHRARAALRAIFSALHSYSTVALAAQ